MGSNISPIGPTSPIPPQKGNVDPTLLPQSYALITLLIGDASFQPVFPDIRNSTYLPTFSALLSSFQAGKAPQNVLDALTNVIGVMKGNGHLSVSDLETVENYMEGSESYVYASLTPTEAIQAAYGKLETAVGKLSDIYWSGGTQQDLNSALSLIQQGAELATIANDQTAPAISNQYVSWLEQNADGTLLPSILTDPKLTILQTLEFTFMYPLSQNPNFSDPWLAI